MKLRTEHCLEFEGGGLSVKDDMHGDDAHWGRLTIRDEDMDWDDGIRILRLAPSELIAIRDFLNQTLPPKAIEPAPSSMPIVSGSGCETCGVLPGNPHWSNCSMGHEDLTEAAQTMAVNWGRPPHDAPANAGNQSSGKWPVGTSLSQPEKSDAEH